MTTPSLASQMKAKRSEMMISELEVIALGLFEERGFEAVSVEEIASIAHTSVRTFYRYFSNKDDVLQVEIDRWTGALGDALSARPDDEPALVSMRHALEEVTSSVDKARLRRWSGVVHATPSISWKLEGGWQLKSQRVMARFFADRLDLPDGHLAPTMLAAATDGIIRAILRRWYIDGGDLARMTGEGIAVLELGVGPGLGALRQ